MNSKNENKKRFGWFGGKSGNKGKTDEVPVAEQDAPLAATRLEPNLDARTSMEPEPEQTPQEDISASPSEKTTPPEKKNFFQRLKAGLSRSSSSLSEGISGIFTKSRLDATTLEELEDLLIMTDLGVETVSAITSKLSKDRFDKEISGEEIRQFVADEVTSILAPLTAPFEPAGHNKPHVVLMVGVNGTGKTTTLGKMAAREVAAGRSVMIAACDTFRAAATEQLEVWGQRSGAPVISAAQGADAAGLAFDAFKKAREDNTDVLFIDTAGRLQNKVELMAELEKIIRVIKKQDESAPHSVLLVLDATTGQNALSQVEVFGAVTDVTGLVMTKLDGTARGGILVAVAAKFGLPIHAIGVGEDIDDFQPFEAAAFSAALVGLPQSH